MSRPLHKGIQRYLAANKPRLTVKDMGGVFVIGKASTVTRQLAHLANVHAVSRVPAQDVDQFADGYAPGISREAANG